jgi:hypothetical protein
VVRMAIFRLGWIWLDGSGAASHLDHGTAGARVRRRRHWFAGLLVCWFGWREGVGETWGLGGKGWMR